MEKTDLKRLSLDEMEAFVRSFGWPRYRAPQLMEWIYRKRIAAFSEMTNLSIADREVLNERAAISLISPARRQRSADGTEKFLFSLEDGTEIESVLIPEPRGGAPAKKVDPGAGEGPRYNVGGARRDATDPDGGRGPVHNGRTTLCISTQAGCSLDCTFCLTGTMGLLRNMKAHEIVDQVLWIQNELKPPQRLTNIVLMGMGEPLANFREVVEALKRLTHPKMVAFPPRRVTLSTSGLVPQIRKFGECGLKVNLAVSLNATTDAVRDRVMPAVNREHPLDSLIAACRAYPLPPRRRLYFEYVLLKDVNDSEADAARLIRLIRGIRCKVNLIPFNEFSGAPFRRPEDETVLRFQKILINADLPTYIRKSRGRDILAACGQLCTETPVQSPRAPTHSHR